MAEADNRFDWHDYVRVARNQGKDSEMIERALDQLSRIPEVQEMLRRAVAENEGRPITITSSDMLTSRAEQTDGTINISSVQLRKSNYFSEEEGRYVPFSVQRVLVHELAHMADPENTNRQENEALARQYYQRFMGDVNTLEPGTNVAALVRRDYVNENYTLRRRFLAEAYEEVTGQEVDADSEEFVNAIEALERQDPDTSLRVSRLSSQKYDSYIEEQQARMNAGQLVDPGAARCAYYESQRTPDRVLEAHAVEVANRIMSTYYHEPPRGAYENTRASPQRRSDVLFHPDIVGDKETLLPTVQLYEQCASTYREAYGVPDDKAMEYIRAAAPEDLATIIEARHAHYQDSWNGRQGEHSTLDEVCAPQTPKVPPSPGAEALKGPRG